jgi:hypothetical protein
MRYLRLVTQGCVTFDSNYASAVRSPVVSPRSSRETSAITVEIRADGIGSGLPEQGGGPLRGGLTLTNRFQAGITDPAVPYNLAMTVGAHNGALACESFTITKRPGSPTVTSTEIRRVTVDAYLSRIRQELAVYLGGGLIVQNWQQKGRTISFEGFPSPERLAALEDGQRRWRTSLTTADVAAKYREALRSEDPEASRRPTEWVAEQFGYSRGHISRMLTQARREGEPGIGELRPLRNKKRKTAG